jgi:DNA-binding response OmpR family regulator
MRRKAGSVSPRVLVVEDDAGIARVLGMCLGDEGFEVCQASAGGEALDILETEPPDAVVLDLGLPDSLGGAVLDRLRRARGRPAPAWVVISALSREEATQQYGPLGSFLAKPFDPGVLVDKLDELLGRNGPNWRKEVSK